MTSIYTSRQILPFCCFFTLLFAPIAASTYAQHCGSVAPESVPTKPISGASNSFLISNGVFSAGNRINSYLFPSLMSTNFSNHKSMPTTLLSGASNSFQLSNGFSSTGNHIHNDLFPSSSTKFSDNGVQYHGFFDFQPGPVYRTHDDGTLQLEGTLVLSGLLVPRNMSNRIFRYNQINRRRVTFKLSGFWSEAKGKLCMVGTGEMQSSEQYDQLFASTLSVVLKLEYPKVSTITTSIIKGSIESLDKYNEPTHFEPVSLLAYAQRKYEYTMSEQAEESCSHLPHEQSVGFDTTSICSNLLKIMRKETFTSNDLIDFLKYRFLSVTQLVCSDDGKVHLSIELSNVPKQLRFLYNVPIQPGELLVAEGVWDHHNNKLCLLACPLNIKENKSSVVEDCYLGLTFWFPDTFSLKQRSSMAGRLWNRRNVKINNRANKSASLYIVNSYTTFVIPGLKYEYTLLDRARRNCQTRSVHPKNIGRYPDPQSHSDMNYFGLSIKDLTNGRSLLGDAKLISVGGTYHGSQYSNNFNEDSLYTIGSTRIQSSPSSADQNREVWDVGYTISYTFGSPYYEDLVDISAEGIYNSTTGTLCMVGCRRQGFIHGRHGKILNVNDTMNGEDFDCTLSIKLQLPQLDSGKYEGEGTISSTRDRSDPLYFEPLAITFPVVYRSLSVQEYDRMNAETMMVIISLTVLCMCSYLQLKHARKHSTIRPFLSITMLAVLTIGCIISIILNTEAMLVPTRKQNAFLQVGGWIETTNAVARLLTVVAFVINYRLLELALSSRSKEQNTENKSCSAEKKSLMFCMPLYIVGALVAWYVHSKFYRFQRTILEELARYVGLLVDNFLLPQIIFNMFTESKSEKVLNLFFYFGVTMVRIVPHIYNAYRAWSYPVNFNSPYIYANHDGDYYSTLLCVIIPLQGLLFALLVNIQQRFGGRCFLPKRFRGSAGYVTVCNSNI